ncbi:alpha/beta hydrolase [Roseobacter sinensis]|uniref:Alpha/beta hydrolase n=1 Tax=Roseobacter sinensis TaxID=2931391 RepID=A0ABT3BB27_9RHOB|nr:alpha/beta hydrolase [Roseobacter sp. WL0113]MCV3270374.1 alpha/beta hydrolase [Roseobacter sp. WL0113]
MPLLRVNATEDGLHKHGCRSEALPEIAELSGQTPGPAIVMIHGYKYDPADIAHCPHRKLFGANGADWPRALGFGAAAADEGLGIAFGWHARGPLKQVHRRASALGPALADVLHALKAADPRRPVHLIAHSLGSEIALAALAHLPARAVDRMLLLTGASFATVAEQMLATPAGRTTEVFNVTSRENDLFDLAFETLVGFGHGANRAIGQGINRPNVANIQLDCDRVLTSLARMGVRVASAERRVSHWSSYTRPGIMAFYTSLLRQPQSLSFHDLHRALPSSMAPRWSRFALTPLAAAVCRVASDTAVVAKGKIQRRASAVMGDTADQKRNEPAY